MAIKFPDWVTGPTTCTYRTFKVVIPKTYRYNSTRHGAITIVAQYLNRPTVTVPRNGLPGFYTKWADQ